MSRQAIDFKDINSRGYKMWRILQSPGNWAKIYRDREERLKNYRGALIFPEQLLGLDQKTIYRVLVARQDSGSSVTSQIHAVRHFDLHGCRFDGVRQVLTTRQEIFDHEFYGNALMGVGGDGSGKNFHEHSWFTNTRDAVKYQQRAQESLLSQIG